MTVYQVLRYFLKGSSYSSILAWFKQLEIGTYASLIGFFHRRWEPQMLIATAWQRVHPLTWGWLILDEIILEKTILGQCSLLKFRWKTAHGYVIPSISVVMLMWTNGRWRIPLRFKLWRPGEGSHIDAALALLSWVRNTLRWTPQCVLFDAGFAATKMLRRLDDYGWALVCRIPRSRRFEGVQIKRYKHQGYWHAAGEAWCGLRLLAVRRADKFYVTNRLSWRPETVVAWYDRRAPIEEVFRLLKGPCHWGSCQLSDDAAYERFLAMSVVEFIVFETIRMHSSEPVTIYQLRQQATLGRPIRVPRRLQRLPLVS